MLLTPTQLRNNKEYTPSPKERVAVQPIGVDASFDLSASLASAEEEAIDLLLQRPQSSPSPSPAPVASSSHQTPPSTQAPLADTSTGKRSEPPAGLYNYRHAKRARQRETKIAAEGHVPAPGSTARLLATSLNPGISTSIQTAALPAAFGGYMAKPRARDEGWNKSYALGDVLGMGLRLIKWNGM